MALSIKNAETERLARQLASMTGESLTEVVTDALRERLVRITGRAAPDRLLQEIERIQERVAGLPVLDDRSPEEIVDYDDHGLPH